MSNSVIKNEVLKVEAHCDSSEIRIGAQTNVHLAVSYNKSVGKANIHWPVLKDTLVKNVLLVSTAGTDTVVSKVNPNEITLSKHYTITSFDSGFYAIPPFSVYLNADSATAYQSEPFLLKVKSVPADTTQAIKDIKPPLSEPFKISELAPYFYGLIALLAVIGAIYFVIKKLFKKEKEKPLEKPVQKIPPHELAMVELEKLRRDKVWQEGNYKLYYSRLSDILRIYIEGRFKIAALEQTTDELMANFKYLVVDENSKVILKEILIISDLVKFAKEQPLANENELSLEKAIQFVTGTARPVLHPDKQASTTNGDFK